MENKINISEILRNKPHGIKLYSPIFGDCTFCYIQDETNDICVRRPYNEMSYFNFEGLYNTAGECLLFPSKEMRDWSRFAWKKGDVLTNSLGFKIFFDKWVNDDYTKFLGKIKLLGNSHCYDTAYYNLVPEEKALEFIKSVEEINNGIFNRETLEIEKLELKDGDIIVTDEVPSMCYSKCIFILKGDWNIYEDRANSYIFYNVSNNHICFNIVDKAIRDRDIHLATEEEKQQLFKALAKENKVWDAEKKVVVNLPKKCKFKTFDKVLCRDWDGGKWGINFFSHYDESSDYPFVCIKGVYRQCIPYNDMTRHLLCTTGEWKGGE